MAWTVPRTWVSGELVTASLMNTFVRDDLAYLKDSPTFDGNVTVTGVLTLSAGSLTIGLMTVTSTLTPQALVDISGVGAGQIKFPATQNASTNVNTLDDYEEGSWTPTIGGSGGQSGQTYTTQVGKYVKVGKIVTCYFNIVLSAVGTITTNAQIQGLPFTSENTSNQIASMNVGTWQNMTTNMVHVAGTLAANATVITLRHVAATPAVSDFPVLQADLSNTTQITGAITFAATA